MYYHIAYVERKRRFLPCINLTNRTSLVKSYMSGAIVQLYHV